MLRLIVIFLLFLTGSGTLIGQQVLEVCASCPVKTLAGAIDQAEPFDTILIKPGTYREHDVQINKPLTIIGEGFPIIDGQERGEIITVMADSVTIRGLEVANVGVSFVKDQAGIYLEQVKDCYIIGNRLNNTFFGIYLEYSESIVIRDNVLKGKAENEINSANAIHLWRCKKILVDNNYVTGHRDGIYFEFVDSSLIKNNVSEGNLRYGLHFMFSNDDVYLNNTFKGNGVGVAVMYSDRIIMKENNFYDNWSPISYGLLLKEIRYSTIKHNTFQKNTSAIYAESVIQTDIVENDFISNGWTVVISGSSEEVLFKRNNFRGNSFEVSTSAKQNYNTFTENYWSGYTGYDLDKDGFGDVPYRPVKLFSYLSKEIPTSIVLLRSPFMNILNHAENVMPVLTPETLVDEKPKMKPNKW